jgi:hypothetical protein
MPGQTSQTLSHSLRNITNTQQSNFYQHNHIVKHHQFTLDAHEPEIKSYHPTSLLALIDLQAH